MTPAARKPVVPYLRAEWRMTERRACGLIDVCRMTVRYETWLWLATKSS